MSTLASQAGPGQTAGQSFGAGQSAGGSGGSGGSGAGQSAGESNGGMGKPRPRASQPGWSKVRAYRGDDVVLAAKLFGFNEGTKVTFKIFSSTGEPAKSIATLQGEADEHGIAAAEWTVKFDPARHGDPRLLFEASAEGAAKVAPATSPALLVCDFADMTLENEDGLPLAGVEVRLVDAAGAIHTATTDATGRFKIDPIALGKYSIAVKDHLAEGEKQPAEKQYASGEVLVVKLKRMVYTIEFDSPKEGEVYLAGDTVDIKATIKRDGRPEPGQPTFRVAGSPSAKVEEGTQGQKGKNQAAPQLVLGRDEATLDLVGEYQGTKAGIKVKVVAPRLAKLEIVDNGGNVFDLYDHKKQATAPPSVEIREGEPPVLHAAVKFGTVLKAKAYLGASAKPSKPAKIVVVLHGGLPDGPLGFRMENDRVASGVEWSGDAATAFELTAVRPLAKQVAAAETELCAYVGPAGWSPAPDSLESGTPAGSVRTRIYAIWNKPAIGDGKIQDPGTEPLAKSHFDAFHVGWNLNLDGEGSIPRRIQRSMRHYDWPGGYEGKDGKKGGEHPRPLNADKAAGDGIYAGDPPPQPLAKAYRCEKHPGGTFPFPAAVAGWCQGCLRYFMVWQNGQYQDAQLACSAYVGPERHDPCPNCRQPKAFLEAQCAACGAWVDQKALATGGHNCEEGGEPTAEGKEPTGKNWGFGVLDHPEHPGGKPHQAASAMAAALNALGVKANVVYLRRPQGAVNLTEHDPVTIGAACFDPKRDWGASLAAFVRVPADSSRDGDFPGEKVHESETIVFDPPVRGGPRRAALASEAKKTGQLLKPECRCGHPLRRKPTRPKFIQSLDASRAINPDCAFPSGGGFSSVRSVLTQRGFTFGGGVSRITRETLEEAHIFAIGPLRGGLSQDEIGVLEEFVRDGGAFFDSRNMDRSIFGVTAGAFGGRGYANFMGDPLAVQVLGAAKSAGGVGCGASSSLNAPGWTGILQETHGVNGVARIEGKGRAVVIGDEEIFMVSFGGLPGAAYGNLGPNQQLLGAIFDWLAQAPGAGGTSAKSCPKCGAQPSWRYKCGKCGSLLEGAKPTGTHSCGEKLEGLVEALIYPCPSCKKTVHDEDADCWNCGTKLQPGEKQGWK
jgi:hypothetical protein